MRYLSERADIVTEHAGLYVHTNIYTCLFGDALLRRVMVVITLNGQLPASLKDVSVSPFTGKKISKEINLIMRYEFVSFVLRCLCIEGFK